MPPELDADAILQAVEAGEDPSALSQNTNEQAQQESAPQQEASSPAEQAAEQFRRELVVDGRKVEVTDPEKYDKWAQQGYAYSQRMQELNSEREQWQKEKSEFETKLRQYEDVDRYATENPDWWNHVETNYKNRQLHKLAPEVQEAIKPFMDEFVSMKEFMNNYQRQQEEQKAAREDELLSNEVQDLQKQFPEINFNSADANGQSLELQVIQHANNHGIPSFRAAFFDYYQGNLQRLYEARGREAVEKDLEQRKKAGILGSSQAPASERQGLQPLVNGRSKSWEDVLGEAKRELGLM